MSPATLVLAVAGISVAAFFTSAMALRLGGVGTTEVISLVARPVLVALCGLLAILMSRSIEDRHNRWVWLLVGAGAIGSAAGDAAWAYWGLQLGQAVAVPGSGDVLYATEYLALFIAVASTILRYRNGTALPWAIIEGMVLSSIAGMAVWFGILRPVVLQPGGFDSATTSDIAYLAADIVFLIGPTVTLVLALLRSKDRLHVLPWLVFTAAVAGLVLSDMGWFWQQAHGGATPGTFVDFGWMASHALLAVSAALAVDMERAIIRLRTLA